MSDLWSSLNEPQATVLASVITVFAAVIGVSLGSLLFGGRVRDLKGSIDQADKLLREHRDAVSTTLAGVRSDLDGFKQILDANLLNISDLKGSVGQLADTQESLADTAEPPVLAGFPSAHVVGNQDKDRVGWDRIRSAWDAIRGELESVAAGSDIDGRTKARYARIDRRKYAELVEALALDKRLGVEADKFWQALEIWNKYKTRRAKPVASEIQAMCDLERDLVSHPSDTLAN